MILGGGDETRKLCMLVCVGQWGGGGDQYYH